MIKKIINILKKKKEQGAYQAEAEVANFFVCYGSGEKSGTKSGSKLFIYL